MADTALPPSELVDWQCFCGYENAGLDTWCAKCGLSHADSEARIAEQLAYEQRKAEAEAREAQRQAQAALQPAAFAPGKVALSFDGAGIDLLVQFIIVSLLSAITLGIYSFWGQVRITRWLASHTLLDGRRLDFRGTGVQFLGLALLHWLLTVITMGIWTPWAVIAFVNWHKDNLYFAEAQEIA